jgi:putative transcriptional regulator
MNDRVTNHIKDYRTRHGYTQDELGQAVGVSRQSINAIERGRYVPSLLLALRFARVFGCSMEELFRLEEDPYG